jgi:dTDP-glucose 4,6-dehydratase
MRVVVTGGCGFIGAAVVRALVDGGHRVLNIDRRSRISAVPALGAVAGREGYARLEADIADRAMMRAIFSEFRPERVIHLAAAAASEPAALFDAHVGGAFSILDAARAYLDRLKDADRAAFRLVHAIHASGPADIDDADRRYTPREAAAATAAALFDTGARAHGVPLVTCIAGDLFGQWQRDDAFVPRTVAALLAGQPVRLDAGGEITRDWLSVRDFAAGLILAALNAPAMSRYEFSAGAERTDLDVASVIAALLDARLPAPAGAARAHLIDARGGDALIPGPLLDPADAESELGWSPEGFHQSLDRTVAWTASRFAPQAALAAE